MKLELFEGIMCHDNKMMDEITSVKTPYSQAPLHAYFHQTLWSKGAFTEKKIGVFVDVVVEEEEAATQSPAICVVSRCTETTPTAENPVC